MSRENCKSCQGWGVLGAIQEKCNKCDGKGWITEQENSKTWKLHVLFVELFVMKEKFVALENVQLN